MTDHVGPLAADRAVLVPDDWPRLRIPRRLSAAQPGWSTTADVIVVGSGIAGLTCALRLRQRVDRVLPTARSA